MGSNFLVKGPFGLPVDPLTKQALGAFGIGEDEDEQRVPTQTQPVLRKRRVPTLEDPEKKRRGRRVTLLTAGQGTSLEGSSIIPSSSTGRSPLRE